MAGKPPVEVRVDDRQLKVLMAKVKAEADGKAVRKDLITRLRSAVEPGVARVQAKLRAIPRTSVSTHRGRGGANGALGGYLAGRVKVAVKLSGRGAGVRVRIGKTQGLRGFAWAARRLNRKSWRHQVFARTGREPVWVEQDSPIPGYFDEALAADRAAYRAAVVAALDDMAKRLGSTL